MKDANEVEKTQPCQTVSAKGLAKILCCTERTVRRWDSAGKIPQALRIGKRHVIWPVSEIQAWMAAGIPDRRRWNEMRGNRRER